MRSLNSICKIYACKNYLSTQVIGYAEIHLHASTTQPPPHTEFKDTVQYSVRDVALLSAASITTPPPVSSGERSQLMIEEEAIKETDIHPLGKLYSVSSHTEHSFKHSYLVLCQI